MGHAGVSNSVWNAFRVHVTSDVRPGLQLLQIEHHGTAKSLIKEA